MYIHLFKCRRKNVTTVTKIKTVEAKAAKSSDPYVKIRATRA